MGSSPTVGTRFRNRGYVFRIRGFLLLTASYANALKKSTADRKKAHATNVTQVSFPYSIFEILGVPRGIRTPDLLVRSQSLYPAELQPHFMCSKKTSYWRLSYITTDWTEMQVPF